MSAQILKRMVVLAATAVMFAVMSCREAAPELSSAFDAKRAFGYLEAQVAFGPRVPGTRAHDEARDWIAAKLSEHTVQVSLQPFTGAVGDTTLAMQNILSSFYPDRGDRILLCAHWDSRYIADKDPDPANHGLPVPGANDGASGVAVLIEVASVIAADDPGVGVDIVFFDGEDDGDYGETVSWLLGSRHFAAVMPADYRPRYALLLDMIGDSDLGLMREYRSMNSAPVLWRRITGLCETLHIPISDETVSITDDHVPLIERGIPAVDLIDFDYPFWHTIADTPDKCSPESLDKIGNLVIELIYGDE